MALSQCDWVFLEVVSSLMEACESQQQLHGDGRHQEHCIISVLVSWIMVIVCY